LSTVSFTKNKAKFSDFIFDSFIGIKYSTAMQMLSFWKKKR